MNEAIKSVSTLKRDPNNPINVISNARQALQRVKDSHNIADQMIILVAAQQRVLEALKIAHGAEGLALNVMKNQIDKQMDDLC